MGQMLANKALALGQGPAVLLSGGESTVTISGSKPGRGGRNTELLLSAAITLQGAPNIWALAGDTDGIDGTEDAAGAIITPNTLDRACAKGLEAHGILAGHDSYSLFQALHDLVITGPTLTNVNDFRAFLVLPRS
jgi:glycerate 2-kinase